MPTLNFKIIPVPPAIFLGDFADLNSFRGINPDAPPKEGLEASEGHIEGQVGHSGYIIYTFTISEIHFLFTMAFL